MTAHYSRCDALAQSLQAQARAAGFNECAAYLGACVDGVNWIAPFTPDDSWFDWCASLGGDVLHDVEVVHWTVR